MSHATGKCLHCGGPTNRHYAAWYCFPCSDERARVASKATRAVKKEIVEGRLPQLRGGNIPCVDCGKPAIDYDHRDYAKPLEVDPVCRGCNNRRGPGITHLEAA